MNGKDIICIAQVQSKAAVFGEDDSGPDDDDFVPSAKDPYWDNNLISDSNKPSQLVNVFFPVFKQQQGYTSNIKSVQICSFQNFCRFVED